MNMTKVPLLDPCKTAPSTQHRLSPLQQRASAKAANWAALNRDWAAVAMWLQTGVPRVRKTVIEASIWYRSDEAFATAFFQHWGTALVSTVKTTTVAHASSKHFILWLCCSLCRTIGRKAAIPFTGGKWQFAFNYNLEVYYMPNY